MLLQPCFILAPIITHLVINTFSCSFLFLILFLFLIPFCFILIQDESSPIIARNCGMGGRASLSPIPLSLSMKTTASLKQGDITVSVLLEIGQLLEGALFSGQADAAKVATEAAPSSAAAAARSNKARSG